MNIEKMKREKSVMIEEMRAILSAVESRDDKKITAEESERYAKLDVSVTELSAAILREERLQNFEASQVSNRASADNGSSKEFRDLGEFISEAISNPNSSRLEKRTTTLGNQAQAGYLVPPEFDTTLRAVPPEMAIVRSRATVIPGGNAPDATFNMIAFDQSGANGVFGGIQMNWVSETAARPNAGDLKVRQIAFTPHIITGYMDISKQLIGNFEAIGKYAQKQMSLAIAAAEERAFLRGSGAGQPTGFIGHPSNATRVRTTAGQITFADIVGMLSISITHGGGMFIASRSAMANIVSLKDDAGNLIFQPSAREGVPSTLMGMPLEFTERAPALGAQGDITLADLSQYYIKDGSPLTLLVDPYSQSINGVTRLILTWSVDAKPILSTPIRGEDAINRSPFVTLVNS